LKIESYPKGRGYAHKTVKADTTITGGHLSGGPDAVRVFESKAEVTSGDMSEQRHWSQPSPERGLAENCLVRIRKPMDTLPS
jgi:hypothetical protein